MKRYQELLALIPEGTYVTTSHLAQELGVSSRTIRSDIAQLNEEIESWGATVVSMPRKGVTLQVSDRELFSQYQPEGSLNDLDQDERVRQIVEYLLTIDHPVLLDDLAEMLFFSRSTLKRDMREVRRLMGRFGIAVDNRAYQGLKATGREEDIRSCLAYLEKIAQASQGGQGQESLDVLKRIIIDQVTLHRFKLSDLAVENLSVHLLIAVKRVRVGNTVELPSGMASDLAREADDGHMDVAMAILGEVERAYDVRFPRNETYNFLMQLVSKEIVSLDGDAANTVVSEDDYRLVMSMLERVRDSYQIDLRHDLDLVTMLSMHLIPLRTRMKYRMVSANPLLDDIRRNYVLAYSMATVACSVLEEEYGHEVPADEVAYIATYLSLALARRRDKAKDNVLIVCGSGRASSELLAYRVRDAFGKYLNVVGTTTAYGLGNESFEGVDYILTTVPITCHVPVPIIEVSTMLGGEDVSKISRAISRGSAERLVTSLIDPELIFWPGSPDKGEVISLLCSEVASRSDVPENFEELVLEREEVGMTSFGNLIAIAHPIRAVGSTNVLALAILDRPIDWGRGEEVQLVFLLTIGQGKTKELQSFYRIMNKLISNKDFACQLTRATSFEEVVETLRLVAETGDRP